MKDHTYSTPLGGLPAQTQLLTDRAVFTDAYAVFPKGWLSDIVTSLLPGWTKTRGWVLAHPLTGFAETFSQMILEVGPGGGATSVELNRKYAPGAAGISLFRSEPISFPFEFGCVERHQLGSRAFIPMSGRDCLVVGRQDDNGSPAHLQVFVAGSEQGVNYYRGTWHGVSMPIDNATPFSVVDWVGMWNNLEEHEFSEPITIFR